MNCPKHDCEKRQRELKREYQQRPDVKQRRREYHRARRFHAIVLAFVARVQEPDQSTGSGSPPPKDN